MKLNVFSTALTCVMGKTATLLKQPNEGNY